MNNSINVSFPEFSFQTDEKINRIKFIVLLILQTISISCYLFIFYNFAINRNLRRSIHNNSILCLLIVSFVYTIIPLSISESYLQKSYIIPDSNIFCGIWNWFQYSLDVSNLHLMAYTSIERHLLIFYSASLRKKWIRRIFHYFPSYIVHSLSYHILFYHHFSC